jgi:hypothetical protein
MIIFIEGPDFNAQNSLYKQLMQDMQNSGCAKPRAFFLDTLYTRVNLLPVFHPSMEPQDEVMTVMYAKILAFMELSYRYPDECFIINNGPLAFKYMSCQADDTRHGKNALSIFSSGDYQNVVEISVTTREIDKDKSDAYMQMSSKHMSVMSDAGKKNKYRLFMYKDDASHKLFNNDIMALINK